MKRRLLFLGSVCLLLSSSFSLADGPKHVCEGLWRTFVVTVGLERRCHLSNTYSDNVLTAYLSKNCNDYLDLNERKSLILEEAERLLYSYGIEPEGTETTSLLSPQTCNMVKDIEAHSLVGGVR